MILIERFLATVKRGKLDYVENSAEEWLLSFRQKFSNASKTLMHTSPRDFVKT